MATVNLELTAFTLFSVAIRYCDGTPPERAREIWDRVRLTPDAQPFYAEARTLIVAIGAQG